MGGNTQTSAVGDNPMGDNTQTSVVDDNPTGDNTQASAVGDSPSSNTRSSVTDSPWKLRIADGTAWSLSYCRNHQLEWSLLSSNHPVWFHPLRLAKKRVRDTLALSVILLHYTPTSIRIV